MASKVFSISRVNLFLENPFAHWVKYTQGKTPKPNPEYDKYINRGTVFHRMAEYFAKGDLCFDEVSQAVKEEYSEAGFVEESFEGAFVAMERLLEERGTEPFENILETEKKIELPLNVERGTKFLGFVDAVKDNRDGTVTLIDYKTFSNAPQEADLAYSLQAQCYMHVCTELGYKVKSFVFEAVNPKLKITGRNYKTKKIVIPYDEALAEDTFEEFKHLTEIISDNEYFSLYRFDSKRMPTAYDTLYKYMLEGDEKKIEEFLESAFIDRK